jgi:hypothetical protein
LGLPKTCKRMDLRLTGFLKNNKFLQCHKGKTFFVS